MSSLSNFNLQMLDVKPKIFTFINPYSYDVLISSVPLVSDEFTIFVDGILLVVFNNFFKKKKLDRFSFDFTSIAPVVFNHAIVKKYNVALVGGSQDEVEKAAILLRNRFEGLNIVTCHNGFIKNNFDSVINELILHDVNVVIAGMGTPLQEEFLLKCKYNIPTLNFGFTCGGFISQIAINEDYFHPFFDMLHLRWLQRFFRHSYVRKRLLYNYPIFIFRFCFNKHYRNLY